MLDWRKLHVFRAVMETGATTLAAERLGLSQPSVSGVLKDLERETRLTLFYRRKGRLEPTAEAHAFLAEVEPLLRGVEDLDRAARDIRQYGRSAITVLSYPGAAWSLMPEVIAEFRAAYPTYGVKLVSRSSETARGMLRSQRFDLALIEAPVPAFGFEEEVYRFTCDVALQAGHPLALKERLSINDLVAEPWTTLFAGHSCTQQLAQRFDAAGREMKVALECDFFLTAAHYVRTSGGTTLIDPVTARGGPPHGLVIRPLQDPPIYTLALLKNLRPGKQSAAGAFAEILTEKLEALTAPLEPEQA